MSARGASERSGRRLQRPVLERRHETELDLVIDTRAVVGGSREQAVEFGEVFHVDGVEGQAADAGAGVGDVTGESEGEQSIPLGLEHQHREITPGDGARATLQASTTQGNVARYNPQLRSAGDDEASMQCEFDSFVVSVLHEVCPRSTTLPRKLRRETGIVIHPRCCFGGTAGMSAKLPKEQHGQLSKKSVGRKLYLRRQKNFKNKA